MPEIAAHGMVVGWFVPDKRGSSGRQSQMSTFSFYGIFLQHLLGPRGKTEMFLTCKIQTVDGWKLPQGSTAFTTAAATSPKVSSISAQESATVSERLSLSSTQI